MCGIAGFFDPALRDPAAGRNVVAAMGQAILHRGPDDADVWNDADLPLFLGHRRLSIIDLSAEGRQPMVSAGGRFVIVYNGEIYNFLELRAELEKGRAFRGHSDTEVMLAAFETWGVRAALERLVGMFAFALYDRRQRVLHLARDRLGEKPLYVGRAGKVVFFASELKALRVHPAWRGDINRDALGAFLRHAYVPGPGSIYRDVYKLGPGRLLSIPLGDDLRDPAAFDPEGEAYWNMADAAQEGLRAPFSGDDREALDELERVLVQAVDGQMVADVPLGAFLSGGIDSSTIVALMQTRSTRPVKTFTIGFRVPEYNEAEFASRIAAHLGTEHTELYVTPEDARDAIPLMPRYFDEPFADPSQLPTYLLAKLTRTKVTVSLSGDGGDELFGGYPRYFYADALQSRLDRIPYSARRAAGMLLCVPPAWLYNRLIAVAGRLPGLGRLRGLSGERIHKLTDLLLQRDPDTVLFMLSHWSNPADLVRDGREPRGILHDPPAWTSELDFIARFMFLDSVTYLPDDILVKVDRAAMAVSLETRVPLLDHRVVEFAWTLPAKLRRREGKGKWLLRELLARHVPRDLFERPKQGFAVPIDHWLRSELKPWAGDLLSEDRLRADGYFEPEAVRRVWREHQSGRRKRDFQLWDLLMFQSWLDETRKSDIRVDY